MSRRDSSDSDASLRLDHPESGLPLRMVEKQAGTFTGWWPTHRGAPTLRFISGPPQPSQKGKPCWRVGCCVLSLIAGCPTS